MMSKIFIFLLTVLFLFSSCKLQNKTEIPVETDRQEVNKNELQKEAKRLDWQEFVSKEGKFKVDFPGVPKKTVEKGDWNGQKVAYNNFEVLSHSIRFEVTYADFPGTATEKEEDLKYIYDYKRDQALELTGDKLVSERDVRLNGRLGREIVLTDDNQLDTFRFYKIGDRAFQIDVSYNLPAEKDERFQEVTDYFFDTFEPIEN